jgi:hypothetical protein
LQAGLEHGAQSIERPGGGQLFGAVGCHENSGTTPVCALRHKSVRRSADRSIGVIEFFRKNEVIMRVLRDSHASALLPKACPLTYVAVQEVRTSLAGPP